MELRHLRYFVAIAEERSLTRAAERLWIAQPGLSTQMRRLEAELGVKLFDRHPRGVDLTDAGRLLLERARAALAAADAAIATGRDLNAGLAGTLRLGIAAGARWHATADVLERFAHERPGVELTVLEGHGGTLWRDLRDGRLDAVIAPSTFASVDLRVLALGSEPWVMLVGKSHELAGIGTVSAVDLNGERIAVTGHRDGAGYDRAVAAVLDELDIAATLVPGALGPGVDTGVARGELLALTTAPDSLPPGVLIRPLDPPRTLPFALLQRDETPSPVLSEFVRFASEAATPEHIARRRLAAVA
jgi:DNA-binding transcriptional LysR family regulator